MMSAQGSNQEEIECWEESSSRHPSGLDLSKWMGEGESCGDPLKPRWSLGVGREEDWEERHMGCFHPLKPQQPQQEQVELEELEEEEEMSREHGQANWMMEQVIKIMWEAFETSRHMPEFHNPMTS